MIILKKIWLVMLVNRLNVYYETTKLVARFIKTVCGKLKTLLVSYDWDFTNLADHSEEDSCNVLSKSDKSRKLVCYNSRTILVLPLCVDRSLCDSFFSFIFVKMACV